MARRSLVILPNCAPSPRSLLNGTKPADLPVLQSTKFELVVRFRSSPVLGSRSDANFGI